MKRSRQRKVEDFMSTAVITMKETEAITSARLEMDLAAIRHIPIVDERSHVIGIVSNRDVVKALARSGGTPIPVAQIMKRAVRTVRPTTPAAEAVETMIEHKIGSLPVVGEDEQLVGIVTETDFLVVAQQALRGVEISRVQPGL